MALKASTLRVKTARSYGHPSTAQQLKTGEYVVQNTVTIAPQFCKDMERLCLYLGKTSVSATIDTNAFI